MGSPSLSFAANMIRRARSASRIARQACGLTCVVNTFSIPNSETMPNNTALMPVVSASVNSLRLPTPIIASTVG